MAIEIQGNGGRPATDVGDGSTAARTANDRISGSASRGATSATDRFSLTDQASQIKAMESQISNLPVVDTKRVTEVQHSMATGEFRVNPARVADKLVNFELGLSPRG